MNNQKIANPKTEVPIGIEMNEKDYLNCLLGILKELEKNYSLAITEASNEHLYQSYFNTLESLSTLQRETYELMFKNGWYSLEKVEDTKINEKYQMLSQEYQELKIN